MTDHAPTEAVEKDHGPEKWERDLRVAGWREVRRNVWERPDGALFRGPYGAWCALQMGDDE